MMSADCDGDALDRAIRESVGGRVVKAIVDPVARAWPSSRLHAIASSVSASFNRLPLAVRIRCGAIAGIVSMAFSAVVTSLQPRATDRMSTALPLVLILIFAAAGVGGDAIARAVERTRR